jgi:hypothetical protein
MDLTHGTAVNDGCPSSSSIFCSAIGRAVVVMVHGLVAFDGAAAAGR